MKYILLLAAILLACITSFAQNADTLTKEIDVYVNKCIAAPAFKLKQYIIPAALFGYGVAGLFDGPVKSLSQSLQKNIIQHHAGFNTGIDAITRFAPAAAVFALHFAGNKGMHNTKDAAIIYAMALGIDGAFTEGLKYATRQWRPDNSDHYSFPSGHASTAFASAEFLRKEYSGISAWYGVAGYAVAAATGVMRMYNNKHWLGDVVAGAGVGIASAKLAYYFFDKIKWKRLHSSAVVMPYYNNYSIGLTYSRHLAVQVKEAL